MYKKLIFILFSLAVLWHSELFASHIIGGYFNYNCLGLTNGNQVEYEVEFRLYRDCLNGSPGAPLEPELPITIFDRQGSVRLRIDTIPRVRVTNIPAEVDNPCVVEVPNLCVEEGLYRGVIQLDRSQGFQLVFQRCCRNNIVDNIEDPQDQGNTFSIDVLAFDSVGCNSSPRFNQLPPVVFCSQEDLNIDLSATDDDGDSLVYSFCAPLNYQAGNGSPRPVPAFFPPYQEVVFKAPQSVTNPIPSSPALRFDPDSGILTGRPTSLGNFVVGFCVQEYRSGRLLTTTRRDLQINTANCTPNIVTAVQEQEQFCDGLSVQFKNNSVSDIPIRSFKWDFGDTSVSDDTSRLREPTYTYSDTGVYTVTLIANPGLSCSDTSQQTFEVFNRLDPELRFEGNFCESNNEIDFYVGGVFEDHATFAWDFSRGASTLSSIEDTVEDVSFSGIGPFAVSLRVSQANCTDTFIQSINLVPNPVVDFELEPDQACQNLAVQFRNTSQFQEQATFFWDFGDGEQSRETNPVHIYRDTGFFSPGLMLISEGACADTVVQTFDSAVQILPNPTARLNLSDRALTLKEAVFDFDAGLSEDADSIIFLVNGEVLSNNNDFLSHRIQDTGNFMVEAVVFNEFNCSDTAREEVFVFDEFEFIIPNVFSPNNDGLNDEFAVHACGVYGYEISIFNRHGVEVFQSNSMNINWDGRINERKAKSGVYFYVIKVLDFRGEYLDFSGTVTLIAD